MRDADVLVENARVGGFARLGLRRRGLAGSTRTSSISRSRGSGRTAPTPSKPGYDFVAQAVGGLMSITGQPDAEGGHPVKVGVAISDVATGLFAAVSILAALLGRERAADRPGAAASGSTCRCSRARSPSS